MKMRIRGSAEMNNISVDLVHRAIVSISRVAVAHYHLRLTKMPLWLLLLLLLLLNNGLMWPYTDTAVLVTRTRASEASSWQGSVCKQNQN